MDLSLEEIIKQKGVKVGRGTRGNSRGMRNRGSSVRTGRVERRPNVSNMQRKPRDLPDKWEHDMFDAQPTRRGNQGREQSTRGDSKLQISNLNTSVTDNDLEELFREFGSMQRATLHYDRNGKSLGTGEIFYLSRASAMKALNQYNGVPLDGKAMRLSLDGADGDQGGTSFVKSRLGEREARPERRQNFGSGSGRGRGRYSGGGGRSGGGGGGGGRGRGRGGRQSKPVVTKEDLDAQMDEYLSKRE